MKQPTEEMLEYAKRHKLQYLPAALRSGWCFDNARVVGGRILRFTMSYSDIEKLVKLERSRKIKVNKKVAK